MDMNEVIRLALGRRPHNQVDPVQPPSGPGNSDGGAGANWRPRVRQDMNQWLINEVHRLRMTGIYRR